MATKQSIAKKSADFENGVVRFEFADGDTREISLSDLTPEIVQNLALHGLSQKGGDSYAGAGTEADPLATAKANLDAVLENLKAGNWTVRTGGTAGPRATMLAEAVARATGKELEECVEMVTELRTKAEAEDASDDDKKRFQALKDHPAVKSALSDIRAERAAAKAEKDRASAGDAGSLADILG